VPHKSHTDTQTDRPTDISLGHSTIDLSLSSMLSNNNNNNTNNNTFV